MARAPQVHVHIDSLECLQALAVAMHSLTCTATNVRLKLQALVYDFLSPTTAITDWVIAFLSPTTSITDYVIAFLSPTTAITDYVIAFLSPTTAITGYVIRHRKLSSELFAGAQMTVNK